MKKIYLIGLYFVLFSCVKLFSQNVVVEIDGDNLFYSEPGCSDCWGDPDPRWKLKVTTTNGTYNWNAQDDDVCGWVGLTNFNWVAPQVVSASSTISMSMDGYEADGFICGADDNVCGGYTSVGSLVVNSQPPCQWNYQTYQRVCGSGTYSVRWSYYWYYQTIDPGTISGDDTICSSDDPDTLRNVFSGSPFVDYQWQYSDDNGTTWNDLVGDTNSFYDPPAGLIATRWFRRVASTCGGVADTASNIVIITVNPSPTVTTVSQVACAPSTVDLTVPAVTTGSTPGLTFTYFTDSTLSTPITNPNAVPTSGTYYIVGTTSDGCPDTSAVPVTVYPLPVGQASPLTATICSSDTISIALNCNVPGTVFNWTVFESGVTGGTLGSDTSLISQSLYNTSGNAGSAIYTIIPTANGCAGAPLIATITVNSADDASFTYPSATFCQSGANPTPTITGLPGGVFFATPTGLVINSSTGVINLGASQVGVYTLSYATNGICADTSSITMTILNANPNANFNYPSTVYCQNSTNPLPVYDVGASAGIFTAIPSGLVFAHINTGEVDLSASAPGTYIVTNTIPPSGSCPGVSDTTQITILPADDASFTYPSATYCTSGTPQTPTITGLAGGTFTVTPAGLAIDSVTGTIQLDSSAVGAYTLSYTTNGNCPNTSSITMTIGTTSPTATFSYIGAPFCQSGNDPFPFFVPGASAGIFSATPSGLVFDHVNTGQIDLSASTPGTYTVTNYIPTSGTCDSAIATTIVTITPDDDASFVYSSATYCTSGSNPTPVITGVPGGAFTAVPVGLALNPSTGTINLATSAIGTYTLTYTTNSACPGSSSITLTITNTTPSATFAYTSASICQNDNNPIPVFPTGSSAGIFSATPAGLVFVSVNTGEVDLSASVPGTYTITNTIPASGTCGAVSATTTLVINAADDASFVYTSATYCQSGNNSTPIVTGVPGGIFSSTPNGLVINPATGTINLAASAVGTYTLTYTTNSTCPNSSSITMTILNANPDATFSYSGSPFCQNINNPFPVFPNGASAGIFTSTPVGLVFAHVNTGEIDLGSTLPGTYTITNTIPQSGSCNATSASYTITINSPDDASFVYSSATYCTSGSNPTPSITGLSGGTFSAIPPGLALNPGTGLIDLATSTVGSYTLFYTTNGNCPNTSSITMTIINSNPAATFTYASSAYCQNATGSVFPVFGSGASAGIFSASPAGLSFVHVNTGEIDLASSTPGTYTVTNTIPSSGTCGAVTATSTITITPSDDASFHYTSATYCNSGTNQTPIITGLPGGIFSSLPGGLSLNPTTGVINLFTSNVGTYTLTYTTNGACPNSSFITMTIADTTPSAFFSYNGPFCQHANNAFPTLAPGSSAGAFSALPAGLVFNNINTGEIDLAASTPGTYNVINYIPASGSCDSASGTAVVVINPSPVITSSPPSQTICVGNTTSITLSSSMGNTNCTWTVLQTGVSGATPGTGPVINQTLNLTGNIPGTAVYTVTPQSGACPGTPLDIIVNVNFMPVADTSSVTYTLANCGGPTGGVSGVSMSTGQAPFQYVWTDAQGATVGNSANLTNVTPGTYTLTVTDSNHCVITAGAFNVNATPPVIAQFTEDTLNGETPLIVTFTNQSIGATAYLWDFGTGDTSNAVNPIYTFIPLGQSTVCLTAISATGCIDTACALVNVFLNSVFVVPNVFTPNGDNVNDIFAVNSIGLVKLDAEIYNRWGEKIYEWHTVNGGWNGRTTAGINATDGTYYYIIRASGVDGKEYFEKGPFALIRSSN